MMAYHNGFVVSIIHNGRPVREFRGDDGIRTCSIPFGSEYKIRIKGDSCNKAKVSVTIDGTPVASGDRVFMLNPYGELELERFVDSLTEGKRFKFVELSHSDVQDPTSKENGIIRVEIQPVFPEFPAPKVICRTMRGAGGASVGVAYCSSVNDGTSSTFTVDTATCCVDGATVEGSDSFQNFGVDTNTYFDLGAPTIIEIKLRGVATKASKSLWKISNGCAFYEGKKLQGVKSIMQNTSGEVVLYLESISG